MGVEMIIGLNTFGILGGNGYIMDVWGGIWECELINVLDISVWKCCV